MTWTYSGNPKASPLDTVRFLLGDTASLAPLVSDEEVGFALDESASNLYAATATLARALAARFSRSGGVSVDGITVDFKAKVQQYNDLADTMERRGKIFTGATPYAGGTSLADIAAVSADPDRPPSLVNAVQTDERATREQSVNQLLSTYPR